MPTLRGTASGYVNNTNVVTLGFAAGSVIGDLAVLNVAHAARITVPGGWTAHYYQQGDWTMGGTWSKRLDEVDIATGSVTVNFSDNYYGLAALACFTSGATPAAGAFMRDNPGAPTRTLTTSGTAPLTGDYALYFGFGRVNDSVTSSNGTVLEAATNLEASYVLAGEALAVDGQVTDTFTYVTTPSGDYCSVLIIPAQTPGVNLSEINMHDVEGSIFPGAVRLSAANMYDVEGSIFPGAVRMSEINFYTVEGPEVVTVSRRRQTFITG